MTTLCSRCVPSCPLRRSLPRHGAQAAPLSERALAIGERALGRSHPQVATWANNLAMLYKRDGRLAAAAPLYARALAIWEAALGPGHLTVATGCNNLAACHREQVRSGE